jgi:hypothetical protein
MIRGLYKRFEAHSGRMTAFMERMMEVKTFGALVFIVAFLGSAWAMAWYSHIFSPWLENLLGLGPYDIDTEGEIRWRRMWSTAICLPGILIYICLYIRNRFDR